jgi:hypothetical protein
MQVKAAPYFSLQIFCLSFPFRLRRLERCSASEFGLKIKAGVELFLNFLLGDIQRKTFDKIYFKILLNVFNVDQ